MEMKSPLEGIRILDLTIWQMGPQATVMLADMGAEVIKIEEPKRGDPSRGLLYKPASETHGLVPYFQVMSRGKRSMTLNLTEEKGREVFYKLVEKADVVTQNWRVGVAEKLKVDYPTLCKYNPNIILVSATSYGLKGPDATIGSTDISGVSRSGLTWFHSRSIPCDTDDIFYTLVCEGDALGAIMTAYATLLGVVARERHGVGQHVEVSQLSSVMWLQALPLGIYLIQRENLPAYKRKTGTNFTWQHYRCQDNKWICLANPQPQITFPRLLRVLGLSEFEKDPRFPKIRDGLAHLGGADVDFSLDDVRSMIEKAFLKRTTKEWLPLLLAEDIDSCYVNDYADLESDPQVVANEYITEVKHQSGVPLKMLGIPVKLSKTPGRIKGAAPEFGQDTEDVLLEAGYTWDQIGAMRESGVL